MLPPGAHCFAAETDAGGADASSVDYDSYDNAVIVEQGDVLGTLTITAVNTFNTPPAPPTPTAARELTAGQHRGRRPIDTPSSSGVGEGSIGIPRRGRAAAWRRSAKRAGGATGPCAHPW